MNSRLVEGYHPDFDLDSAVGRQGELWVADIAHMIGAGTGQIEVKTDQRIANTGNVYIEYECLRRDGWFPSGIATTKALVWAFVLPANVLIAAPVENVRDIARNHWRTYRKDCVRGSHPTRGVAIPVGEFVRDLYRFEVQPSTAKPH